VRILITLFAIIGLMISAGCARLQTHHIDPKPPHTVRVTSYNLHWQNGFCDETAQVICKINPDILILQEVTQEWDQCLSKALNQKYPYHLYKCHGREGGLAFYARYPLLGEEFVPPTFGWFPAWLVDVDTPYGRWQLLSLHLRPPVIANNGIGILGEALFTTPNVRKLEMEYLYTLLDPFQPTIIAGDFNENDFGGATRFLRKVGMVDALWHDKQWRITWRWHAFPLLAGRYDRMYYWPSLTGHNLQILHEGQSDHYPVTLDFQPTRKHRNTSSSPV